MPKPAIPSLVLILAAALAGCGGERRGSGTPGFGDGGVGGQEGQPDRGPCAKMDLLFIIDDSGSMKEEQDNLAANFPKFVQLLDDFKTSAGATLDYRIGITTTGRDVVYTIVLPPPFPQLPPFSEKGDNGVLRQSADCGMTRRWIERADPGAAATFSCAAQVGTGGPSIEMPLNSIKLALGDRVDDGTNADFLRPDALLAIIMLTDENDCSREDNNFSIANDSCDPPPAEVQPVQKYLDFLDGVKQARERWAAAVIAGAGPGSCSSGFGMASEATRLKEFVSLAGDQAIFSSICAGDLTQALQNALEKFTVACESFTVL